MSLLVTALICGFWKQNSAFWTRITSRYGSQTSPVILCMQSSVICTGMTSLYGFQPSSVVLCLQNSDLRTRHTSLYGSQTSSVVLSTYNSGLSARIKRLYWFQPSPVVLCIQNSMPSIRTSLYGAQHSSEGFEGKTRTFRPELQVSMCTTPHLSFCECKTAWLAQEKLVPNGPSPLLWFSDAK